MQNENKPANGRRAVTAEQNMASYRRFIDEAYNEGNVAVLDEIASPALVLHFLPPSTPPGPESMKRHITSFREAFPDVRVHIEDMMADGDKVIVRYTMTGTHRGPYMNHLRTLMPATGKQIHIAGIDIFRFDSDGKWAECWSTFDRLGVLQQLGVIPLSGPVPSQSTPATVVQHS